MTKIHVQNLYPSSLPRKVPGVGLIEAGAAVEVEKSQGEGLIRSGLWKKVTKAEAEKANKAVADAREAEEAKESTDREEVKE